jgi:hypothetical protein
MIETGVGFPNPLFFIGVVENNIDERLEGRVQVRAFGIHGTNQDIPTADLPWATLIIGSHDVNFTVPPLNAWVFGFFLDGRAAQQPFILGLIPTQFTQINDPTVSGWGVSIGNTVDVNAQGSRAQDFGQPTLSRLARGEDLEETYLLPLESTRVRNIPIAGGGTYAASVDNMGVAQGDTAVNDSVVPVAYSPANEAEGISAYGQQALSAAATYGVPPDLFFRMISQESTWNPSAVSPVGAQGLTQVMPNTALDPGYGIAPMPSGWESDPQAQLNFGAQYLSVMYDKYGSWDLALAAYNAGPGSVDNAGGVPNNAETQNYVATIHGGWLEAGAPTDGLSSRYAGVVGSTVDPGAGAPVTPTATPVSAGAPGTAGSRPYATWDEPSVAYNAEYPYNRVIETGSGHVIELDDTPGVERIMIYHKNGSYIQMSPTTTTIKSPHDMYNVNEKNYHMYVGGTNIVTIEKDCHVLVKGNKIEEIMGDYVQIVHGNHYVGVAGQMNMNGGEQGQIRAANLVLESNVENLNIKTGKTIRFESGEAIHFKSKNLFMQGAEGVNIKGENLIFSSSATTSVKAETGIFEASGNFSIKADHALVGGGQLVSINASTVAIDQEVKLSQGMAGDPEGSEEAADAEAARPVEAPPPPPRSISTTTTLV